MEARLTTPQLLKLAREAGFEVSERRLEDWRYRRLLPRPARAGSVGKAPRWLYPQGTDQQLLELCRLRAITKDIDSIRVGLWVAGYPIGEQDVRTSIGAVLQGLRTLFERGLEEEANRKTVSDQGRLTADQALESLAYRAAGMKGDRPAPKTIRMLREDRARGIAFMARLFMGYELEIADAAKAERAMGISAGRRGDPAHRWLSGPPAELAELRSIISLPVLTEVAATATADELVRARALARAFVQGLPFIARFAEATVGPRAAGLAVAKNIADAAPDLYCMLIPALVAARRIGLAESLDTLQTTLDGVNQLVPAVEELAALPDARRRKKLERIPAGDRPTARLMLELTAQQSRTTRTTRTRKPKPKS